MRASLEAQRIRTLYRRLVLLGAVKLPLDAARKLVGPDCAYHLYYRHARAAAGDAREAAGLRSPRGRAPRRARAQRSRARR